MEWIKRHLRQLRWQLTLSYTAVTVVTLLVVVAIIAGVFFSQILLPNYVLTPTDWINIAREQGQVVYEALLSKDSIDAKALTNLISLNDPVIVSHKLFLFGDLEIYARSTGKIDVLITDRAGRLIAFSRRNQPALLESLVIGEPIDPGLVPELEQPLEAALQGKTDPYSIYHAYEDGDGFLMAIPIFNPEVTAQVVGVIVYNVRDISTQADRGAYFGIVLLRSLVIILIAAVLVGATFGALTAEGLAGRFRRLASASEAWAHGDFSTRIREESSDEIGQLASRLDGMAQELQELVYKRQELAVTQERNRLARDLHDSAKQIALAASFHIATARELFERNPQAASESLEEAEKLVDRVRTELTDLIHELRTTHMDGMEFSEILRTYTAEWSHSSGIGIQLDLQVEEGLPIEVEEALYRIMQEALANIARHSGARQASVQVEPYDGEVQLSVRDDGVGFDEFSTSSGIGLTSMRERAEAIGGFTRITSQPGKGTEVRVVLPLSRKGAENG